MSNGPVHTIQCGRGTSVQIWENRDHEGNRYYNLKVQRAYKQGSEWKYTESLRADDALRVAWGLQQANGWLLKQQYEARQQQRQQQFQGGGPGAGGSTSNDDEIPF